MDRIVAGAGILQAGEARPGGEGATAMTKLFSCQVKTPQPLADCGDCSIRNGKKDRVTCPNQFFHIVKSLRASPCRRFLGRSFVPAVIAGHWNAALDKKLSQGEANFSRSKESYLHVITMPFQGR